MAKNVTIYQRQLIANIEIGIFLAFQSIETTQKQRECIVLNFKHL